MFFFSCSFYLKYLVRCIKVSLVRDVLVFWWWVVFINGKRIDIKYDYGCYWGIDVEVRISVFFFRFLGSLDSLFWVVFFRFKVLELNRFIVWFFFCRFLYIGNWVFFVFERLFFLYIWFCVFNFLFRWFKFVFLDYVVVFEVFKFYRYLKNFSYCFYSKCLGLRCVGK